MSITMGLIIWNVVGFFGMQAYIQVKGGLPTMLEDGRLKHLVKLSAIIAPVFLLICAVAVLIVIGAEVLRERHQDYLTEKKEERARVVRNAREPFKYLCITVSVKQPWYVRLTRTPFR